MSNPPMPANGAPIGSWFASPRWTVWVLVAGVFLAGLACRLVVFDRVDLPPPFQEGDEAVYRALVEQLDRHMGYTLQGHQVLASHIMDREYYDRPLFFHPPGAIGLLWLCHRLMGPAGYGVADLFCYAVFFWSMMLLGWAVLRPMHAPAAGALALLAAFTPIMAHVMGRIWIDGPLLAFATAATATFVAGAARRNTWFMLASAVLLGYASLIKLTAVLVVPGMIALALAAAPAGSLAWLAGATVAVGLIAGLIQAPWELAQLHATGSMFPSMVGKPSAEMLRVNPFLRHITVEMPAWSYLVLLPQILWTFVPATLLWAWQWKTPGVRRKGLALLLWIALILTFQIALAASGYTKAVRHVILITPATVLLFALAVNGSAGAIKPRGPMTTAWKITVVLLALAAAGLALEVAQGVKTGIVERGLDAINPLTGVMGS